MSLHPDEIPRPVYRKVTVAELPETFGPPPSKAFVQSVAANGVLEPVLLLWKRTSWHVMAGNRRIAAARLARVEEVPAMVFEPGSVDPSTITLIENAHRSINPAAEMEALAQLCRKYSEAEVVAHLGIDAKTIRARVRLHERLDPAVVELMKKGEVTMAKAKVLAKLPKDEQLGASLESVAKIAERLGTPKQPVLFEAPPGLNALERAFRDIKSESSELVHKHRESLFLVVSEITKAINAACEDRMRALCDQPRGVEVQP
jgi:ParB/RepB/Spo0J family partition protein